MDIDYEDDTAVNCKSRNHANIDITGWNPSFENKGDRTKFKLARVDHIFEFQ
jgi:hypothetical protein